MRLFALALLLGFGSTLIGGPGVPATLNFEIVIRKDSTLAQRVLRSFERAFSRQGIVLQVQEFPSQRGILELRRGRVDGSIGRVGDLEKLHGIKDYQKAA